MIKKTIKNIALKFGYSIYKVQHRQQSLKQRNTFSMQSAIERCVKRGLKVNTVIDVGASDGRWSRNCINTISNAKYLLIEAQKEHEIGLKQLKEEYPNANYVLAAAGRSEGEIYFNNGDLFGGLASEKPFNINCIKVPVISLDHEVAKQKLEPPYLLKLDTHGFEVPILEGAKNIIKSAQLIIIETYNYKLTDNSLKYYEMCSYMEKLGFSSIEMVDFMNREYDDSFWQMDTFFVPSTNKEFLYNSYT
ncbi:FkbM family methyltransferase [uncultured Algibacter sp.]|uniref:FkbM family methyltransferase n=1 Tax=uncultured Algibacter sp. TaxID=298659 RepID=UPI0026305B77|nr:FkbM family methyltransferase [uncultured Algibacter sp.]